MSKRSAKSYAHCLQEKRHTHVSEHNKCLPSNRYYLGAQQTSLKKGKIGGDMKQTMPSTQSPLLILMKPTLVMNVQYTFFYANTNIHEKPYCEGQKPYCPSQNAKSISNLKLVPDHKIYNIQQAKESRKAPSFLASM